jgi:hypothetical protein
MLRWTYFRSTAMQRVSAAAPPVRERKQARAACLVAVVAVGLVATVRALSVSRVI